MTDMPTTPVSRPALEEWNLSVVEAFDVEPRLRRVVFTADTLDQLDYRPGQALVLRMPLPEGGTGRRDYTIRSLDREAKRLAIDFVLHGATPAPNWARAAQAGDTLLALGPRGRSVIAPGADWHLFCVDETGMPALRHMLERVPAGTIVHALIESASSEDETQIETAATLTRSWLARGGIPAGPNALVLEALRVLTLPAGKGQAYLMGETSNVRSWRHHLVQSGLPKTVIASEGYWRPGRIGGHDHVDD
ncbi:MAG TPA: siderophore-interacting protein [Bosea sp. (in: a-proteobacteria)]|jgi:NADPH-dependent ferric siderophore reductase|nr:siderophore-interacting protein [Bosea sp. (in: a-proteobacteria)]